MANQEHLSRIRKGSRFWNEWALRSTKTILREDGIDLSRSNLRGANLSGMILKGANLHRANLINANLSGANLNSALDHGMTKQKARSDIWTIQFPADLTQANLSGADLSLADLTSADLTNANLQRANLYGTNLSGAILAGANLKKAVLWDTIFARTTLTGTKGLDECQHRGASSIDHFALATLDEHPLSFLRGCGLPENLIDYLPSLLNQAIQFYSCFISYSTKDQDFADRLHADLQDEGVRCWFAPYDMAPGKKMHEQTDEAIRLHDKLLLILSKHSMNSERVKTEISIARKLEIKEQRRMLFPVSLIGTKPLGAWECFDADTGKDSAREIREYFVPDFSDWKTNHDVYQENFDRLVESLKSKDAKTAAHA